MIRIDQIWLAVDPIDMRCCPDTALAKVVQMFGAAHPHTAYPFNRLRVLVHDGLGVWLAARRLNQGRFVWPRRGHAPMAQHEGLWHTWCP